jgi:outer membrane protein TolC
MRQTLNNIIAVVLICYSYTANTQTLQELVNVALANNYQIRILKNKAQIASNNNTLGNTGMLPSVDLNGAYTTSFNNTRQEFADGSVREGSNAKNTNINLSVLANWTIFNGFSVYAKKSQLNYLEELGQLNSKFYIEQTVSDIVMAYHQLVYEKQLLKNYQQTLNISAIRLNIESKRKEIGSGKAMDFGQALVDYQTDSIRLLAQQNTIQSLEIELNRILINPLENEIIVNNENIILLPISSKEELMKKVEVSTNQLEQERLQELIAETELRMTKASRYPKIDLFAGYQYSKTFSEVGFFRSNQNYGPTVGVSVSFNLFNGGANNREIKNTKIYSENAQLNKQQVNQNINADVLKFYNEYLSMNKRITLAKSNVENMQKVYIAAEEQLKKGAINGYDFRLTQLSLLNSEITLMQLQLASKAIELNLNRLSGTVLSTYM